MKRRRLGKTNVRSFLLGLLLGGAPLTYGSSLDANVDKNGNQPRIQIVEDAPISCLRRLARPGAPLVIPANKLSPYPPIGPRIRRATVNGMGYEATSPDTWDPITRAWVRFGAATDAGRSRLLLNVGCAFGSVSNEAAQFGARVVCNDLDERHLAEMKVTSPEELHGRFVFLPGDYCADCTLRDLKQVGYVDAILMSRVLHFFPPEEFRKALKISHDLLKPKGRIYIVTSSPYLRSLGDFYKAFESKKGNLWPGYLDGEREKVSDYFPTSKTRYPESMNFVDPTILTREVVGAGFKVIRSATYLPDVALPWEHLMDGRELVGIVGERGP